jgi:hypothetical protein
MLIGDRTETYAADSPLATAALHAIQAEVRACCA